MTERQSSSELMMTNNLEFFSVFMEIYLIKTDTIFDANKFLFPEIA